MIKLALAIAFVAIFGLAFMWLAVKLAAKFGSKEKTTKTKDKDDK